MSTNRFLPGSGCQFFTPARSQSVFRIPLPRVVFILCRSADLSRPVSKRILGRRLVAFRAASGKASVMDAHCSHMGADLGCGTVTGESIQCPFHQLEPWNRRRLSTYCSGTRASLPAFARQTAYPVEIRHGYVFFFNGERALFPLPFFFGAEPEKFSAGKVFSYVSDCNWFTNAAHGFDTQHFDAVHGDLQIRSCRRKLTARIRSRGGTHIARKFWGAPN